VTDSNNGSAGTDGGSDDEAVGADSDLDAVQPVSSSLRSAQHRGAKTDASADATEEQADGDGAEADPDGLDELASVTSSLRSAQSRVSGDDDPDDDGDLSASDAGESGDA